MKRFIGLLSATVGILLVFYIPGCGIYSFSGQGIGGIKTISIQPFDNQTAEFGIREELTDAVLNQLLRDRTLTVTDPAGADALLKGTVLSVTEAPLTFSATEVANEYKVTIVIEVLLVRPDKSEPLWSARLTGEGNYPYKTGSPDERQAGIKLAIERLVQDLTNRLTSDW